ncbi:MAG: hypothetical protein EXR12_11510 [Rhodospirillaceae bacterium]|nr:hypothetical protein [Rhodospirillaceae bacterium]
MSNFFKTAFQWPTAIYQSGKRTTATLSFLAIFVVILIQLHAILKVPLLPVFELSFTSIRQVAHLLLDWVIFSWLLWILQAMHFAFTLPFSFPVLPTFPDWGVPPLVKDASIASIVLVRAFEIAYLIVPQADRDSARESTTAAQWVLIRRAQGPIATNIHLFVESLNKGMYQVKDIGSSGNRVGDFGGS